MIDDDVYLPGIEIPGFRPAIALPDLKFAKFLKRPVSVGEARLMSSRLLNFDRWIAFAVPGFPAPAETQHHKLPVPVVDNVNSSSHNWFYCCGSTSIRRARNLFVTVLCNKRYYFKQFLTIPPVYQWGRGGNRSSIVHSRERPIPLKNNGLAA